jgi:phage shock protein PspC (stress-responsive transcriptional regulator)
MKKVININFQGRIIPIEETAFEQLKQYIESLRRYFAGEEGREEIINDIQDRIGELFNDELKAGSTCITDADLEKVIANMGRPEDFEASENSFADQAYAASGASTSTSTHTNFNEGPKKESNAAAGKGYEPRGRLYRNAADKVLGGVCSGLAHYFKIDPVVIRILFVIMVIGGFGSGILLYLVLWIVLPQEGLDENIRKRLFRNPDDRMIGGVCGGIAAYFNIEVWIPRLIFAGPFLISIILSIIEAATWSFHHSPVFFANGFGGSLIVIYIVLWAVLPEARTASERLEMRGAKVDLESIKATVQDELQSLKERTVKMGGEFSERAQEWGEQIKTGGKRFSKEAAPIARRTSSGVFNAIGILFKAFFLIIVGIIGFSLLIALIASVFATVGSYSLINIFLGGFWEHFFFWSTLLLFMGVPVVALFFWIIRMIIGSRARTSYLRYALGGLWLLGLVSAICLAGMIVGDLRQRNVVRSDAVISQPTGNRILVRVKDYDGEDNNDDWNWHFGVHLEGFMDDQNDSIFVSTVRLRVMPSQDGNYHMSINKYSQGRDRDAASEYASHVTYNFTQQDSILYLSKGLVMSYDQRYRGQRVRVDVMVPVGKHIYLDESVDRLNGRSAGVGSSDRFWDNHWDDEWDLDTEVDYVMTAKGLVRADGATKPIKDDGNDDDDDQDKKAQPSTPDSSGQHYKYHSAHPEHPEHPEKPEHPENPKTPKDPQTPNQTAFMPETLTGNLYKTISLL